jgi:hypothetical protein
VALLRDIRIIFRETGETRIRSAVMADHLNANEEAPWCNLRGGKGIDANGIASRLKGYEIKPGTVKLSDGSTFKGYKAEAFADAWSRYLADQEVTVTAPVTAKVTAPEPRKPAWEAKVTAVTAESGGAGGNGSGTVEDADLDRYLTKWADR